MEKLNPLFTRWGRDIDRSCPLAEYPRPQLKRDSWLCLNGVWQYAIRDSAAAVEPGKYDGEILVPFSPESLLSGVGRQLLPGQVLWYRREFNVDAYLEGLAQGTRPLNPQRPRSLRSPRSLILHFGAVDQCCDIFVNGSKAGSHAGGYWPFSLDISGFVRQGSNVLTVAVTDDSDTGIEAYGKQKLSRGGIWYTAQSGIWQTVWLEPVPEQHITGIRITPCYEASEVEFAVKFSLPSSQPVHARIFGGDALAAEGTFDTPTFRLPMPDFRSWSPADPFLYTVKMSTGSNGDCDNIESYFGMRQFSVMQGADSLARICLNGKPLFHNGLLDQGYWSDGMYTAPSDEAMVWELSEVKRLGFNMLRKHIKIEPLRWYYHCDRLGLLVWQDFVSGGGPYGKFISQYLPFIGIHVADSTKRSGFGRCNKKGRAVFERDMVRTAELLGNVVSLAVWVPFNEGWGQFDASRITDALRAMDNTRLVDHASGWHDQQCGDFASHHVYYKPFRMPPDAMKRIQALTEFGGYSLPTAGHMASQRLFGYRMYKSRESFTEAFRQLYAAQVIPKIKRGLSAAIYTQLSDVEDEINGLFTSDRAELKADSAMLQAVNQAVYNGILPGL